VQIGWQSQAGKHRSSVHNNDSRIRRDRQGEQEHLLGNGIRLNASTVSTSRGRQLAKGLVLDQELAESITIRLGRRMEQAVRERRTNPTKAEASSGTSRRAAKTKTKSTQQTVQDSRRTGVVRAWGVVDESATRTATGSSHARSRSGRATFLPTHSCSHKRQLVKENWQTRGKNR
jgi:hypothetical protein